MTIPIKRKHTISILFLVILLTIAMAGCVLPDQEPSPTPTETQMPPPITSQPPPETDPMEPVKGTVNARELKIRTGVGDFHELVDTLIKGDTVEILEIVELNGVRWGKIERGWICLKDVQLEGEDPPEETTSDSSEFSFPITGKVISEALNLRKGPGTQFDIEGKVKFGDTVVVTEMDGTWGKTENGWLNTVFAYFPDSMDAKKENATVTADVLNVREGPSTNYDSVRKLEHGDKVEIIKQVSVRDVLWGYIGDGWICMDYVDIS